MTPQTFRAIIQTSPNHWKIIATITARDEQTALSFFLEWAKDPRFSNTTDWKEWHTQNNQILEGKISESAAALGHSKTPAKAAAARQNGRKGGRPRKTQAPE